MSSDRIDLCPPIGLVAGFRQSVVNGRFDALHMIPDSDVRGHPQIAPGQCRRRGTSMVGQPRSTTVPALCDDCRLSTATGLRVHMSLVDPSARIAETARVALSARIGPETLIGDFAVVEGDVEIGPRCTIEAHAVIKRWTSMGADNQVSSGAILGSDPLDKAFRGDRSYLKIGDGNRIREHFTISRGTSPESETVIGDRNFIMTSGHIAHNCHVGNDTVIASGTLVSGYVEIEDRAFVSGLVAVQQYLRIGEMAMVGGMTRVNQDVTPYLTHVGPTMSVHGLNRVGLRRAGLGPAEIDRIRRAYRILFRSDMALDQALCKVEAEIEGPHARHMVEFIRASRRGVCRRKGRAREGV